MIVLCKPRKESTCMKRMEVTTESWNRLIANPMIRSDKSSAPLVIWGNMVARPELDEYGLPRCTGDNVERMFALQVDVDNGCTIDSFVRDYHRYSFQLYTSYSYGFKEGDRFRVIFPLKEALYTRWLVPPVKQTLISLFDMCDVTCFDKGHWQILPCVSSAEAPYRYIQHDGERLSFASDNFAKVAAEYSEEYHWRREIAEADRDPNANHSGALRYAQTKLDSASVGERNRTMFSVLGWLKNKVNATYSEVIALKPPMGMEVEFNSMVSRLFG